MIRKTARRCSRLVYNSPFITTQQTMGSKIICLPRNYVTARRVSEILNKLFDEVIGIIFGMSDNSRLVKFTVLAHK